MLMSQRRQDRLTCDQGPSRVKGALQLWPEMARQVLLRAMGSEG